MIRHLSGTVVDSEPGYLTVSVQGVGYCVAVVETGLHTTAGETISLHTHLAVRETALDLYGFTDNCDLALFELLLTLPQVGPKSAMQFMRQADRRLIEEAAAMEDPSHLSKLSGIGKKSAEKIVLGLKGKLTTQPAGAGADATAPAGDDHHDAIEALIALGYPQAAAREAIRNIQKDAPELLDTPTLLNQALKHLSRG